MMKKLTFSLICMMFLYSTIQAQQNRIMQVNYKLLPISKYYFANSNEGSSKEKQDFDIALRSGYDFKFHMLVDMKDSRSVFKFDTLIVTKVKGKEDYWTDPENKLGDCVKDQEGNYYRKESLFEQTLNIRGNIQSIDWEITNEKKEILGFPCIKAVSKNKNLLLTAWFTTELPVMAGPANYQGLPGLVLWAEDFFNTISIEQISYSQDEQSFEKIYQDNLALLKNDKNETDEKIFLLKKSQLVKQLNR